MLDQLPGWGPIVQKKGRTKWWSWEEEREAKEPSALLPIPPPASFLEPRPRALGLSAVSDWGMWIKGTLPYHPGSAQNSPAQRQTIYQLEIFFFMLTNLLSMDLEYLSVIYSDGLI